MITSHDHSLAIPFSRCELPSEFGGIAISTLAYLKAHPENPAVLTVDAVCSKCGKPIQTMALFARFTACDECRERYLRDEREHDLREYWRALCPPSFEETDVNHAGFPRAQYDLLKDYQGTESLIFLGDTGTGKTRLAILLLRRLVFQFRTYVGILWPEDLKSIKYAHDRLEQIHSWGTFSVLLLDDSLLTGAQDERLSDFLKDLIDYRSRYKRVSILTSQVGGDEYEAQAKKFKDLTPADVKRIEGLNRRIRENARLIPFPRAATADAKDDCPF